MACPTGISAADNLNIYLSRFHGNDRCIKITIVDEELSLQQNRLKVGDFEADWDRNVLVCLEDGEPCYILYRLDTKTEKDDFHYAYLSFVPNETTVRNKMLYAATRATLRRIFGDNRISMEMHGTVPEELSLQGYRNNVLSQGAKAPMTAAEIELEQVPLEIHYTCDSTYHVMSKILRYHVTTIAQTEVSKDEAVMRSTMQTHSATLPGLNLPVTEDLSDGLTKFKSGFINYLQVKLDTDKEELKLWDCSNISAADLPSKVPDDEPRYHLFNFQHDFEGEKMWKCVFVYSCPGYNVPVKQRMMYSSTKASFLGCLEQMGIEVAAKKEISDGNEVSENEVYEMVHPPEQASRQKFIKPKGPPRSGRKLIR